MNVKLPQLLPHCEVPTKHFCGSCRDRERGRSFRMVALDSQGIEGVHPDFDCPLGLPWKSVGLGDSIDKALRKFGFRKKCGKCKKRQKKLNELFPYKD